MDPLLGCDDGASAGCEFLEEGSAIGCACVRKGVGGPQGDPLGELFLSGGGVEYLGFGALDDFRGPLIDQDGVGADMLLTMEEDVDGILGETIGHRLAGEPLGAGVRPAEIDFSGFKFFLGVKCVR